MPSSLTYAPLDCPPTLLFVCRLQVGNKAKIENEYGELEGRLTQLRSERDQLQGRVDVIRDRVGGPSLCSELAGAA